MEVKEKITHLSYSKSYSVPEGWRPVKLDKILEDSSLGGNYNNVEGGTGIPLIKMGNLNRGKIDISNKYSIIENEELQEDHLLKRGDILFNTRNTLELVGKVAIWNNELDVAYYNSNLLKLDFDQELVASNRFMNFILNSYSSIKQLKSFATGTTSVAAIYGRDLKKLKILLPPKPEQQKIALILSTWDQAIEKTQNLIDQLELRKKGLIQVLLSGEKRLPGHDGEWKRYEIAEIASQFTDKNSDNKISEVLSCTKYDGLVRSLEYFGRKVYGDDLSKYKVVPRNYFAYATNHIEEGSIGYQDLMDAGLVSPMYTVFKTNSKVDDSYLFRLLKTDRMIYHYQSNMSGSVARRGGLRWNTFKELIVKLPGIDEQKAIASLLDEADNELNLQSEHLDSLKSQKKGLMQQLLTGKKRVHE